MLNLELIGRLGADAKLETAQNGNQFISFSVATENSVKLSNGEIRKTTHWAYCVKFISAESRLLEAMKKGAKVFVRGALTPSVYFPTDASKTPTVSLRVFVDTLTICEFAKEQQQAEPPQPMVSQSPNPPSEVDFSQDGQVDDLPF